MTSYDYHFVLLATVQEEYFKTLLEELIQAFTKHSPFRLRSEPGCIQPRLIRLHDSYRQAQAALSIKWILGKNRLDSGCFRMVSERNDGFESRSRLLIDAACDAGV